MEKLATYINADNKDSAFDWQLLDMLAQPLAMISVDRRIKSANLALGGVYHCPPSALVGKSCCELFCQEHEDHAGNECLCDGLVSDAVLSTTTAHGQPILLKVVPLAFETGTLLQFENVTGQVCFEKQLRRREEQDKLLFTIIQRLLSLPISKIDSGINFALQQLGQFLQVDRCYLFRFDQQTETISNSHEWVSANCDPEIDRLQNLAVGEMPWFWTFMAANKPVSVNNTDGLPAVASVEKAHWQSQSIQSLLVTPLQVEETLYGFLGVDAVAAGHRWRKSDLKLLEMSGEFLCSIVERRSSSLARETSDRRFSALADAAPALIWETGSEGEVVYGNRSWQDFTGATTGGENLDTFIHPEDLTSFNNKCVLCLDDNKIISMELRLKRADGEYRWMQATGAPLHRASNVQGMIVSAFDVTDHKVAEEQLLTLNEDLEMRVIERTSQLENKNNELHTLTRAIEQAPCSIVITDLEGCIEYVNPKFSEVTGYSPEEVIGQNPRLLKGEDGHTDYAKMWQTLNAGAEWRGEFHNRKKNSEYYWEIASISPVTDRDGQIRHFVAVKEDITRRKELEKTIRSERDDLQQAKAKLQDAYDELKATQSHLLQQEKMASIGQLAAGVAHEINNPVGFIKSNLATLGKYVERLRQFNDLQTDTLSQQVSSDLLEPVATAAKKLKIDYLFEDIPDLISESVDGAERVKTIVQNLKSFSRVDQSQFSEADLNECLESTINIVWNELKYKVTMQRDLGDIPRIKCFPQQLNQVFMNILVNGAQAIEDSGEISVQTALEGDNVVVRISDNGCGISEENLKRIFEPFFTTKDVGKGTGLGMSISYDIVEKHGGELQVESEVGKGTTFSILLPLEGATPPETDPIEVDGY